MIRGALSSFSIATSPQSAGEFNTIGKALREKHGLTFCYHQHGYEFVKHGDGTLFDLLMEKTYPQDVSFELDNKLIKTVGGAAKKTNLANSADPGLDDTHAQNFIEAIRGNAKLNAPIEQGFRSTLMAQLGNIAHRTGRSLKIDPTNGHILDDPEAAKLWTRQYEPGWEPTV